MATVTTSIKFVNVASGATIQLSNTAEAYLRAQGGSGFGLAPRQNRYSEGASGTRYRSTRKTPRLYTLPLVVIGDGRQSIEDRLRALGKVISSAFKIVVTYSTGRSFSVTAYYESGLEGAFGPLVDRFTEATLVMKCPDPDWTSSDTQTAAFSPVDGRFFFPYLSEQRVSAISTAAAQSISNPGDVEAPITWRLTGPIGSGSSFLNTAGLGFTIDDADSIDAGEVITIKNGRVTDQAGNDRYDLLGPSPVLFRLPPGSSAVNVSLLGTTYETRVEMIWPERREVVYG